MPTSPRPLTNDALGKKGERRFGEMCDDAQLIANAAEYDRAGWDYIVDFRYPTTINGLDARPSPLSARIQVKTQWTDRDTFKVRLSAAEQLAKHPGPSFFCILSVDEKLDFTSMNLLHCRGEVLERILKRLRQAEADRAKPNEIWLTMRPADFSAPLPPTGEALKSALEAACAQSAAAYISAKDIELTTLGFENGGIQIKFELSGNQDAIADSFLGLGEIEARNINATRTRFGVELPFERGPKGSGLLRFEPKGERCRLVFKTASRRFEFAARSFHLPEMVAASIDKPKIRIAADTFSLLLTMTDHDTGGGTINYRFTMEKPALEGARKTRDWDNLYGVFASVTGDGAHMEIHASKKRVLRQFIKIEQADQKEWRSIARVSEAATFIFNEGGAPNAKVSLDDIWGARQELLTLATMSREPDTVTGLSFTTDASVPLPRDGPFRMMLGHAFQVGDHVLAYTAGLEITGEEEGENWRWSSRTADLMKIRRVRSKAEFLALLDTSPRRPYRVVTGVWQAARPIISRREP